MTICLCHGGICELCIRCSWPPFKCTQIQNQIGRPEYLPQHRENKVVVDGCTIYSDQVNKVKTCDAPLHGFKCLTKSMPDV